MADLRAPPPTSPLADRVRDLALNTVAGYKRDVRRHVRAAVAENLRKVARFRVAVRADSPAAASVYAPSWELEDDAAAAAAAAAGPPDSADCLFETPLAGRASALQQHLPLAPLPAPLPDARTRVETAGASLASIALKGMRKRKNRMTKATEIVPYHLPKASPVPRFDAWVPVNKEFWISNEFMVEPYMPWFGDDEGDRGNAYNVYRKMANEGGDEDTIVSDGEIDARGNFTEPDGDDAWHRYDSVGEQHRRAACRAAISAVCARFDRADLVVVDALVSALDLPSRRHVLKMLDLADARAAAAAAAAGKRAAARREAQRTADAWVADAGVPDACDEAWYLDEATAPLTHFCFTCHVFLCPRHNGHNVEPIIPIKDLYVETRMAALKKVGPVGTPGRDAAVRSSGLRPCGTECHLAPMWDQVPEPPPPSQPADVSAHWTKEERLLFRESVCIFKRDSCSVAKMIGPSKTCRDTYAYMHLPDISTIVNKIVVEAGRKRWPLELNRGGQSAEAAAANAGDDDNDDAADRGGGKNRGRRVNTATKAVSKAQGSNADDDESTEIDPTQEADFKPCAHQGPCDKAVCSCFVKGLKCEATCGCNTGRWTARGYETPGRNGVTDKKKVCQRRHWGCSCKPGEHCNTSECECWDERRSCDPDFCDHCNASILPSQIESDSRSCRNVGVLTGRHKRTIIGHSSVHGFGLFAGEVFEKGDLIGIYGGGIMDSKKADRIGHLYDAKDHTFFFDVTQSLVVDGGMLGMKVKYVNHRRGEPHENAESRCVRVRGMAHIGLFAKRRVEVGEEFMFDYKFQVVIPEWAKSEPGTAAAVSPETPDRSKPEPAGRKASGTTAGLLVPRDFSIDDVEVLNLDSDCD